jgi:autotransporter-associated beta strand protein
LTLLLSAAQPSFAAWGSITSTTAGPVTASANGQTLSLSGSGTISGVSSGAVSTGGFSGLSLIVGQGRTIAQSNGISTGVAIAASSGQISTLTNQGIISSSIVNSATAYAINIGSTSGTTITNNGIGGSSSNNYGQMYTSSSTGSSGGRASAIDGGSASTVSITNENGGNSGSIYWGLIRGGAGTSAGAAIKFTATSSGTSYTVNNYDNSFICSGVCTSVPVAASIDLRNMTAAASATINNGFTSASSGATGGANSIMNGSILGATGTTSAVITVNLGGGTLGSRMSSGDSLDLGGNQASTLNMSGGTIQTNVHLRGQTIALSGGTINGDIYDSSGSPGGPSVNVSGNSTVGTLGANGVLGALAVNSGTLTVTGNTFNSGTTSIGNGAQVTATGNTVFGGSTNFILGSSGVLELDGTTTTSAIDGSSNASGTLSINNSAANVTLGAAVGGSQSLSAVNVSSGALSTGSNNVTAAGGVNVSNNAQFSVGGGAVTGGVTVGNSATVAVNSGSVDSLTLNGSATQTIAGGTLSSLSFGSASSSAVNFSAGTVAGVTFASGSTGTLNLQGTSALSGDVVGNGTGAGAGTVVSTVDDAPSIRLGTGADHLAGVTVNDNTTLTITHDVYAHTVTLGSSTQGATLQVNTGGTLNAASIVDGAAGGGLLNFNSSGTVDVSGAISGTGSVTQEGSGTTTLSGTNSYQGGTTVSAGTLSIGDDANLGNTSGGVTLNGGTLQTNAAVTSARGVALGSSNGTLDTDGNTSTFSGNVTGVGGLTKVGAGTLILSGSNNYAGGTTVSAGTLQGNTASLPGDIINNAAVVFDQASDGTYAGIMSGAGSLTKQNAGTLTFSGINNYQGGTTIQAGTLRMGADNALYSSGGVTVGNGATFDLGGHPQTLGAHINNGTTNLGTAALSATSYSGSGTLKTTLSSGNAYGTLNVSGTANLSGSTLAIDLGNSFTPSATQSFKIVSAGSVSGPFAAIVNPSAAISLTPTYSADGVTFQAGSISYQNTATTPNEMSIATALQNQRNATGDIATVTGVLNTLSAPKLAEAFNQISPVSLGTVSGMVFSTNRTLVSTLSQRFSDIRTGQAFNAAEPMHYNAQANPGTPPILLAMGNTQLVDASPLNSATPSMGASAGVAPQKNWSVYTSGEGTFGHQGTTDTRSGVVPGYRFTSGGFTTGFDRRANDENTVGLSAGYSSSASTLDAGAGNATVETVHYGADWTVTDPLMYANLYVGGAHHSYGTTRNINFGTISRTAAGSTSGEEFTGRIEVGREWVMKRATVTPFANVQYTNVLIGGFSETGADALDMTVKSQEAESLRTQFGGRLSDTLVCKGMSFSPTVSAAWQHEYKDDSHPIEAEFSSGGGTFTTQAPGSGENSAILGAGLQMTFTKNISGVLNYSSEVGRTAFGAQTLGGSMSYRF